MSPDAAEAASEVLAEVLEPQDGGEAVLGALGLVDVRGVEAAVDGVESPPPPPHPVRGRATPTASTANRGAKRRCMRIDRTIMSPACDLAAEEVLNGPVRGHSGAVLRGGSSSVR